MTKPTYISINSVVDRTKWGEGLKASMINDFVVSKFGNVVPLIMNTPKETSINIQKNVIGFASNKNTYGQADNLAEIIHKMVEELSSMPKRKYTTRASTANYPMGEVLVSCSGWIITKKTLPDGRIVYNAKINPETPKNRGDWNEIKGEIYTETGFKWGRFSAFEKWGLIASEAAVIKKLCDILGKYYQGGDTPASVPDETPETAPTPAPQPEQEKNIGLYVNGEFIQNVASEQEAYEILTKNFVEAKLKYMIENNQVYFNMSENRIDLIRDSYQYGKKWGVPKKYGDELQFAFINKGYKVYVSAKNSQLVIYKNDMVSDGLIINDNGGEFNIDKYGYNISVASVNYVIGDENNAVSTSTLAGIIDDVYNNERNGKGNEEAPTTTATKSKEDIEKAINGLQYLADNGNEKAIKAIKGLQYLLNK